MNQDQRVNPEIECIVQKLQRSKLCKRKDVLNVDLLNLSPILMKDLTDLQDIEVNVRTVNIAINTKVVKGQKRGLQHITNFTMQKERVKSPNQCFAKNVEKLNRYKGIIRITISPLLWNGYVQNAITKRIKRELLNYLQPSSEGQAEGPN